jgi:hypothetical protein
VKRCDLVRIRGTTKNSWHKVPGNEFV